MTHRVLIIDDDTELCELVTEFLRREGLEATAVHTGEEGVEKALSGEYAVVVLDVMLPSIGGFEVLRRIRSTQGEAAHLPVLMLTARGDEVDRVLGLELGADDYLAKPFSSRELVARIRAILRRTTPVRETQSQPNPEKAHDHVVVGDLELDSGAREVRRDGQPLDLTAVEYKLLELLLRDVGEVVTREAIALEVLGRTLMSYDRSVDTHVSNLRRKLGSYASGGDRIKTIRGIGYVYALPAQLSTTETDVVAARSGRL
jgi:DNA-binding response OmpR family regulator